MKETTALIVAAAALAVALFATMPPATAADGGAWACYTADKFPDVKAARAWHGAKATEEGLNAVASNVTAGTIITAVTYPQLICVKE